MLERDSLSPTIKSDCSSAVRESQRRDDINHPTGAALGCPPGVRDFLLQGKFPCFPPPASHPSTLSHPSPTPGERVGQPATLPRFSLTGKFSCFPAFASFPRFPLPTLRQHRAKGWGSPATLPRFFPPGKFSCFQPFASFPPFLFPTLRQHRAKGWGSPRETVGQNARPSTVRQRRNVCKGVSGSWFLRSLMMR